MPSFEVAFLAALPGLLALGCDLRAKLACEHPFSAGVSKFGLLSNAIRIPPNEFLSNLERDSAGFRYSSVQIQNELPNHQPDSACPEGEELRRLLPSYAGIWHPQNEAEHTLVRQLALATIRLRCLERMEEQLWQQNEPSLYQIAQCEGIRTSSGRTSHRRCQSLETLRKERDKSNPKPRPEPVEPIKPKPALKRDIQAELDAIVCRLQSLAEIDALLGNRSRLRISYSGANPREFELSNSCPRAASRTR